MTEFIIYRTDHPIKSEDFIRHSASDYTNTDCSHAEILREAMGKPSFADRSLPFFSLSHSGGITVCAMGPSPCGVDVQEHRFRGKECDTDKILRLANRFFHPEEAEQLNEAPRSEITPLFFRIWTAKESYVKYTGEGVQGFKSFSVFAPHTFSPAVIRRIDLTGTPIPFELSLTAQGDFCVYVK